MTRHKEYYGKNKEVILSKNRERYRQNKEIEHMRSKTYYEQNKEAILARRRENYAANREERRKYQREWSRANKEKVKGYISKYTLEQKRRWNINGRRKVKLEVIEAYGGRCVCCGEDRFMVLQMHHVNGDGAEHRREIGLPGGYVFYSWLKKQGFPKEGYELLCCNCHAVETWRKLTGEVL